MLFGCEAFVSNILCGPNRVISIWRGSGGTRIMTVELESKAMVSMAPHTHSLPFFFSFRRQSHLLLIMYCRLSEPHTICRTFFCCVSSIRWLFFCAQQTISVAQPFRSNYITGMGHLFCALTRCDYVKNNLVHCFAISLLYFTVKCMIKQYFHSKWPRQML